MISANFSRTLYVPYARFHFSTDIVTACITSGNFDVELSLGIIYVRSLGMSLFCINSSRYRRAEARAGAVPLTFTDRDAYVSHSSRSILFTIGRADLP